MKTFSFSLHVAGADLFDPDNLDALYRSGQGDASFGEQGGIAYAEYDREASTLTNAVLSAMREVEAAVPGLEVRRVEPEELVSAADIAARVGRTRESISLLISGERGPGNFPGPITRLGGKRPLWRWSDVSAWFRTERGMTVGSDRDADAIAGINGALDLRRYARQLRLTDQTELIAWVDSQALTPYRHLSSPIEPYLEFEKLSEKMLLSALPTTAMPLWEQQFPGIRTATIPVSQMLAGDAISTFASTALLQSAGSVPGTSFDISSDQSVSLCEPALAPASQKKVAA